MQKIREPSNQALNGSYGAWILVTKAYCKGKGKGQVGLPKGQAYVGKKICYFGGMTWYRRKRKLKLI